MMIITEMRAPICTVMSNVNVGKTSLIDKLNQSNRKKHEAGGITQKVSITDFDKERIMTLTREINKEIDLPGIYIIDTPGHEHFQNQRQCSVNISDLVIVLVDIFKGVEKQTADCIELLKKTRTPFIVAANKMDTVYGWKESPGNQCIKSVFKFQPKKVKQDIEEMLGKVEVSFAEHGLNAVRYYQNTNMREFISIVPVSAKTGDGIPDLLMLINILFTRFLKKKLVITNDLPTGLFLETVKHPRFGEYITSIITDGFILHNNKILFINDQNEIEQGEIKQLLMPDGVAMTRMDAGYLCNVKLLGSHKIKSGSTFYAYETELDSQILEPLLKREIESSQPEVEVEYTTPGIFLHAPSTGMLTALHSLCVSNEIPVAGGTIGEVKKTHVLKATIGHDTKDIDQQTFKRRYKTILAYDVTVSKDVDYLAQENGVMILKKDIIYNLVDEYIKFVKILNSIIRDRHPGIMPKCRLTILEQFIFRRKDPIIIGMTVKGNDLHKGMLIATIEMKSEDIIILGKVEGIQKDGRDVNVGKVNEDYCVKITPVHGDKYEYNKDFNGTKELFTYYTNDDEETIKLYPEIFK